MALEMDRQYAKDSDAPLRSQVQRARLVCSRREFTGLLVTGLAAAAVAGAGSVLSGCNAKATADAVLEGTREVTDDTDRASITIPTPSNVHSVFFTSGLAEVYMMTLVPDLIAGLSSQLDKDQLAYLPDGMAELPVLGTIHENGEIDRETIMALDVDIIFSISGQPNTAFDKDEAENLQEQTGIPTLLVDGSFDKIADAYRYLGDILGVSNRAEELAIYCEDIYTKVSAAVATVPDGERISLYYAEGPEGLQTEPDGSQHMLGFLIAGANDAAVCDLTPSGGMTDVSLESVLAWDPEVIVSWDESARGGAANEIRTNKAWSQVKAVRDGRVYEMPNLPWAWCDRPPGVNRFIGIQWIANMLYPSVYDIDMVEVTKDFYSKMYLVDLSDDDVKDMLGNSYPPTERIK